MAKKFEAAVYWIPSPGGMGRVKKKGSAQVCEQYVREQKAKHQPNDEGFPKFILITDRKDCRLNDLGHNKGKK
jgi:hypothetical protein